MKAEPTIQEVERWDTTKLIKNSADVESADESPKRKEDRSGRNGRERLPERQGYNIFRDTGLSVDISVSVKLTELTKGFTSCQDPSPDKLYSTQHPPGSRAWALTLVLPRRVNYYLSYHIQASDLPSR